ncbi:putative ATP-binding component of ABC transporter [Pseudomonas aeruginosa PA38182]|nr:putative ATP-binding component of ABC transporter [Pseudomonas aeruginosa PA38182]
MNAASRQPSTLPADALLAVDGVSLEYRTRSRVVRATQRVSFEVDPADRFVLLGPSGCGKSTLLKAVAGFITPSEGEIRLQGQAVRRPAPTVSWCSRSSTSCRHGRPYGRTCCSPCGCPAR